MADQFKVQLQELAKIQSDFQKINAEMQQMSQRVAAIKSAVEKAAMTDLAAGGMLGIANFFAVAGQVASKVNAIADKARALEETKKQLTEGIGEDAQKIKKVIAEYEAAEKKIHDHLGKINEPKQPPAHPKQPGGGGHTRIDGTGGGGGGGGHTGEPHHPNQPGGGDHGGGGGGGDHGGHDTSGTDGSGISNRPGGKHDGPKLKDHSTGDWKTQMINGRGWDDWSPSHKWHPRNGGGAGMLAEPKLDGVSDERKAMVERAMERVDRKLGYSQGAETNGYRVDCSGFVSCAWGLPGPGTTTGPLISESGGIAHHIPKSDMQPGDAMVVHNSSEQHVVLFGGWANAQHTEMIILEDSGSQGCVSRKVSLASHAEYTAIRKNGM
ncbi:hypothetical protein GCM10010441_38830 [Kitasatospora paracochleata]|uniref:Prefoldin subunit 5 n=1 Tax=Kitasatospora paracochleata TaxID=58354 RepID=A0ABT1IPB0_9ACTN|nr:hypothetical protein [Kitasatospora paracochleata]MCP2306965.1 prefoldin subunit 5 [Kitasatospora paracochleata]